MLQGVTARALTRAAQGQPWAEFTPRERGIILGYWFSHEPSEKVEGLFKPAPVPEVMAGIHLGRAAADAQRPTPDDLAVSLRLRAAHILERRARECERESCSSCAAALEFAAMMRVEGARTFAVTVQQFEQVSRVLVSDGDPRIGWLLLTIANAARVAPEPSGSVH